MSASFSALPSLFVEEGERSDSDGSRTVFSRGTDSVYVQKDSSVHKISFAYSSEEDVLFHLSLDNVRQMMARYSSVAVHNDGIDVYFLPTLVPHHMENDFE